MVRSNEINMNLAAVTPAVLLIYLAQRGVKFLLYALLKIGKSRDETYATFRQIVLDIERLLIMRHAPPSVPPPLTWGSKANRQDSLPATWRRHKGDTLSADDLGMLMLHIHECRTILWQDRNRFSSPTIRNLAEDLAELAGERGK
jgi:ATP synthase regulation protein NCA2